MPGDDRKRQTRRLVVWLVVTLCVLAELLGLGLVRASGATSLGPPVISSVGLPTDPTTARSASFLFTNAQTVLFRCSLDGGTPTSCGAGLLGSKSYPGPLPVGRHVFEVRAANGSGTSDPATYAWTVVAEPVEPSPLPPGSDDAGGNGGDGTAGSASSDGDGSTANDSVPFEISGEVGGLAPGVTKAILLTLRNPNPEPIRVTEITVEISAESTPPGCASASNVALQQADGITEADPVVAPGRGAVVLPERRAPTITLRDRPWNQDVCKGRSFVLTYTGTAHA